MSADDKLQDSILSVVRANRDEDGIHINQILTELRDKDRKDLLFVLLLCNYMRFTVCV